MKHRATFRHLKIYVAFLMVISLGTVGIGILTRDIIMAGKADYVAMSRPFVIEPDIANKFFWESKRSQNASIAAVADSA